MHSFNAIFGAPSIDGLGVKCWRGYCGSREVRLFDRPGEPDRFMLRVDTRSGEHVLTAYRRTVNGVMGAFRRYNLDF